MIEDHIFHHVRYVALLLRGQGSDLLESALETVAQLLGRGVYQADECRWKLASWRTSKAVCDVELCRAADFRRPRKDGWLDGFQDQL